MKHIYKNIHKSSIKEKLSALFYNLPEYLLLLFCLVNSLFVENRNIVIYLLVVFLYILFLLIKRLSKNNIFKFSFLFMSLSVFLYVLDGDFSLTLPIQKLSEWSYFFLLGGIIWRS